MTDPVIDYTDTKEVKVTISSEFELRIKIPKTFSAKEAEHAVEEAKNLYSKLDSKQILFTLRGRKRGSSILLISSKQLIKYDTKTEEVFGPVVRSGLKVRAMSVKRFNALVDLCLQKSFISPCVALYERSVASGETPEQSFMYATVFAGKLNRLYTGYPSESDFDILYKHWSDYGVYQYVYGVDAGKYFTRTMLGILKTHLESVRDSDPELVTPEYVKYYIGYLQETL